MSSVASALAVAVPAVMAVGLAANSSSFTGGELVALGAVALAFFVGRGLVARFFQMVLED